MECNYPFHFHFDPFLVKYHILFDEGEVNFLVGHKIDNSRETML